VAHACYANTTQEAGIGRIKVQGQPWNGGSLRDPISTHQNWAQWYDFVIPGMQET
jgi:hypothetical protein